MSSRPMEWSREGKDRLSHLRIYWMNGGGHAGAGVEPEGSGVGKGVRGRSMSQYGWTAIMGKEVPLGRREVYRDTAGKCEPADICKSIFQYSNRRSMLMQ